MNKYRFLKTFVTSLAIFSLALVGVAYSANDVILATMPYNVGGGNEDSVTDFIITLSVDRNNESVQSLAPDIIYDPALNLRHDLTGADILTNNNWINALYVSEGSLSSDTKSNEDDGTDLKAFEDRSDVLSDEVYVPDSDDDCPVNELVPLPIELQEYLWTKCKKATGDYKNYYAFCLSVMEHESTFRASATHKNSNGSIDRGIMQINSSNVGKMKRAGLIGSADDLYDAYRCIECGVYMLNNYISMFGVSESAYYAYNTGREREGSNKNSRKVMQYMQKWNALLFS